MCLRSKGCTEGMKSLKVVHFSLVYSHFADVPRAVRKTATRYSFDRVLKAFGPAVASIGDLFASLQPQPELVPIAVFVPAPRQATRQFNVQRHGW